MRLLLAAALSLVAGGALAQASPPPAAAPDLQATREALRSAVQAASARPPVDYARPNAWLCRPGRADACGAARLDAVRIAPDGTRTPAPFTPAAAPKLDCFYVYPTDSQEPATYSDMTVTAAETETAGAQFARFAQVCRPFAPMYRQLTLSGLKQALAVKTNDIAGWTDLFQPAYADVLAAWRQYLAHDNHGRGVVLIGHSQGAILLQKLLAEEIDGKPAQRLLVSAFLAGDPGLAVPAGAPVGGTFQHIPLCAAQAQTGCVYAWGSYAVSDGYAGPRRFGVSPIAGDVAACVDPAAPGGGEAPLTSYLRKPAGAPAGDPPWLEVVGGFAGRCVADAQGDVLRVKVTDAPYADMRRALVAAVTHSPSWGLHLLDVNLVQGDMLAAVAAQARTR
ncbi:MAG: DUF3089 domain-containing protein [Caulobacteraceae bacterium]|nr:DUF3089 domain-containing protein [Caulobacter sp.]